MSEPTFDLPELSENLVTIIAPLGDEPNVDNGLSAQQLRNKFDEGGKNIRNFLNNTLSPAIRTFLRSLNTSITNLNGTLTSDYRTASAQDEIDGAITEDIDDITDDMASADMLGIVIDGNSTSVGAFAGQYVIVKNSTISGVTDGLYKAALAIPANTAINSTYLTSVIRGGLNDLISVLISVSNTAVSGVSGVRVVRSGKLVNLQFNVNATGSSDWLTVASGIPKPIGENYYFFTAYDATAGVSTMGRLYNGALAFEAASGTGSSHQFRGSTTYFTND